MICVLQADVKIQNAVTLGATALNNNSAAYASYAILLDQALGQAVRGVPSLTSPRPQMQLARVVVLGGRRRCGDSSNAVCAASLDRWRQLAALNVSPDARVA